MLYESINTEVSKVKVIAFFILFILTLLFISNNLSTNYKYLKQLQDYEAKISLKNTIKKEKYIQNINTSNNYDNKNEDYINLVVNRYNFYNKLNDFEGLKNDFNFLSENIKMIETEYYKLSDNHLNENNQIKYKKDKNIDDNNNNNNNNISHSISIEFSNALKNLNSKKNESIKKIEDISKYLKNVINNNNNY